MAQRIDSPLRGFVTASFKRVFYSVDPNTQNPLAANKGEAAAELKEEVAEVASNPRSSSRSARMAQ